MPGQIGALTLEEAKAFKVLRNENARLKRLVADQALTIQVLKDVNPRNG